MPKFIKKPVAIDADQWFKNGDHPEDICEMVAPSGAGAPEREPFLSEGKVVRRYRNPKTNGTDFCRHCSDIMHNHGWIDTLEGGHIVCPADWIIKGIKGEFYPCKPDIFKDTYFTEDEYARLS